MTEDSHPAHRLDCGNTSPSTTSPTHIAEIDKTTMEDNQTTATTETNSLTSVETKTDACSSYSGDSITSLRGVCSLPSYSAEEQPTVTSHSETILASNLQTKQGQGTKLSHVRESPRDMEGGLIEIREEMGDIHNMLPSMLLEDDDDQYAPVESIWFHKKPSHHGKSHAWQAEERGNEFRPRAENHHNSNHGRNISNDRRASAFSSPKKSRHAPNPYESPVLHPMPWYPQHPGAHGPMFTHPGVIPPRGKMMHCSPYRFVPGRHFVESMRPNGVYADHHYAAYKHNQGVWQPVPEYYYLPPPPPYWQSRPVPWDAIPPPPLWQSNQQPLPPPPSPYYRLRRPSRKPALPKPATPKPARSPKFAPPPKSTPAVTPQSFSERTISTPESAFSASLLASATPEAQKDMIGERLYHRVHELEPDRAERITGILLEADTSYELLNLLESPEEVLRERVDAVLEALKNHQDSEEDEHNESISNE